MTRFAWLQSRTQTFVVVAVLAVLAVVAAVTGARLSHLYDSLVAPCAATGDCGLASGQFQSHYTWLQQGLELTLRLAPALVGAFWGAPLLARELETGTFRLVWTQGVTPGRWLTTKLLLVGAISVAATGVLTLMTTWWFKAIDTVSTNQWGVFDRRNLVPVAYAVFAFSLGAFLGAVMRRTLPAMAATLAIFAFARVAVGAWIRPHLLAPLHTSSSLLSAGGFGFTFNNTGTVDLVARSPDIPNAWVESSHIVTGTGQVASAADRAAFIRQYCPGIVHPPTGSRDGLVGKTGAFDSCQQQAARVFHLAVRYQPAGRYWTFQWLEAAIFVGLAVVCAIGCYWWGKHRTN
jgi:hypothetical protein